MAIQMLKEDRRQTRNGQCQTDSICPEENTDQHFMDKIVQQQTTIEKYIDKLTAAELLHKSFVKEISDLKNSHANELLQMKHNSNENETSTKPVATENILTQTENIPSQEVRHYRKRARQLEIAFDQAWVYFPLRSL